MTQSTRERIYIEKNLPNANWVEQAAGNSFEFDFNEHIITKIPRRYRYFMVLNGGISVNFGTESHNESVHFFLKPQSGSSFMSQCNNGNCYVSCWGNEMTEYLTFPPHVMFKCVDLDYHRSLKVDFWANTYWRLSNVKMKLRMTIFVSTERFEFSDFTSPVLDPGPDHNDEVDDASDDNFDSYS